MRSLPRVLALVVLVFALDEAAAATRTLTVTRDRTPVMAGPKTLGYLPKGTRLVASAEQRGWYRVQVTLGGKVVSGWVHRDHVSLDGHGGGLEAQAAAELKARKAQAEKLAAQGKVREAVALIDAFPERFWQTAAAKAAVQYGLELERRLADPARLDKEAEAQFKALAAKAQQLARQGKLKQAIEVLDGFRAKYATTRHAKQAEAIRRELQRFASARIPNADEKAIREYVGQGRFADARAHLDSLAPKGLPATNPHVVAARAYISLHEKAAAAPEKPSPNPFAADPYAAIPQYHAGLRGLLRILGPTNRPIAVRFGKAAITMRIPTVARQADQGRKLSAAYPWSASLPILTARTLARSGKLDSAVRHYDRALELDCGHTLLSLEAALEKARTLVRAKRPADAVGTLKASLKRCPDDPLALGALGDAYLAAGDKAKAVAAWAQSRKLNPAQHELAAKIRAARGQPAAPARPKPLKLTELYQKVQPSCVGVQVHLVVQGKPARSSGSGFVVSSQGLICTNFHVIAGSFLANVPGNGLSVRFRREGKWQVIRHVQIVLISPLEDIAILKVDARGHRLPPLPLGSAKNVLPGEEVVVVGHPGLGGKILDYTITRGIVSNRDRELGNNNRYLQTDAITNPGNSGGPMFNLRGEVVGLVSLKASVMERTGFALHIDQVQARLPECFPVGP